MSVLARRIVTTKMCDRLSVPLRPAGCCAAAGVSRRSEWSEQKRGSVAKIEVFPLSISPGWVHAANTGQRSSNLLIPVLGPCEHRARRGQGYANGRELQVLKNGTGQGGMAKCPRFLASKLIKLFVLRAFPFKASSSAKLCHGSSQYPRLSQATGRQGLVLHDVAGRMRPLRSPLLCEWHYV